MTATGTHDQEQEDGMTVTDAKGTIRTKGGAERQYEPGMIRVSAPEIRARLEFLGLTEEDLGVITAWEKVCRNSCDRLVDEFYDHILANPATSAVIEEHTTVAKQRPLLTRYILSMFAGRVDDEYLEYRRRVGARHDEIDLDSSWYVAMYGIIQRVLTDAVREAGASSAEIARFSQALQSLIRVDIALCMGALMDSRRDQLQEQQRLETEKAEQASLAINQLIESVRNGKLDARGDAEAFDGSWGEVVSGVNDLIDAFMAPFNVSAEYIERISKGDIPDKLTAEYKGDFNEIKNNLNACIHLMNGLLEETSRLIGATKDGQLDTRGNAEAFEGGWGNLVGGVNELIDAFVAPINVTAEYVDRISKGDIPEKITAEYKGDFNEIKNNLNACVDNVGGVTGQLETMIQAVKAGDLTIRGEAGAYQGSWAAMISGINEMMQPIHDGFVQVAEATDQIASASGQVASSSQQVAEGASEQASSLEETSSSLEEMESMAKQNADNAQQARALSGGMKEAADHGTEAMGRMIGAMGEIRESAESTAAIIKDINEIAFQTNLLALNAAVEAARAGDAGRGFAVVAEEVRNLALRAKDAAQRTESLINQSVKLSEQGGEISNGANENLSEIVGSIAKVTDIISEIAAASDEQSRGIEQVNKAVAEMDKVVQQAAANSEETSSASEELSGQAQELAGMVGRFQLSRSGRPVMTPRPSPMRASGPARAASARPTRRGGIQVKAEDLIPLEDDPDLADF